MKTIILLITFFLLSASASAECNLKKAARNEVLDKKIGVSGRCDTQKAIKKQVNIRIDNKLEMDVKQIKNDTLDTKEKVEDKVTTTKKIIKFVR